MTDNLILIGMPGSGKSTVGVLLAKTRGSEFVDTDLIIQRQEGRLLQDILNCDGIDDFLQCEEKAVLSVTCENAVVATGGSAVLEPKGMEHLKRLGRIIYLHVPLEELTRRIQNITTRGIVIDKGQTLADVYRVRSPLYRKYADVTIDWKEQNSEEIVSQIQEILAAKQNMANDVKD